MAHNLIMARMIDQIRASKLPSGMMQFAARGALQVPSAENIEILVHLAVHNKVFGELARMTLAGWDEKASRAAAADPQTPPEVLNYMISPDNLRPALLPELLENPSLPQEQIVKLAVLAGRETIEALLKSTRVRSLKTVLETLKTNPYLKKEEAEEIKQAFARGVRPAPPVGDALAQKGALPGAAEGTASSATDVSVEHAAEHVEEIADPEGDESVSVYMTENATEIAAEGEKKFQAIGGMIELGSESTEAEAPLTVEQKSAVATPAVSSAAVAAAKKHSAKPERMNTLQKINSLDVKGRIQLALKGNKEERSILIRDGTKVVALAVLEAPKLSDGEVEKFASQKNVLEAVLRQIPLKRRFMKNYIVVRNLVANPRTPLDLGLGLMKNLLAQDLKNLSANKEVSETIRKLALKMFKQKTEEANKKK